MKVYSVNAQDLIKMEQLEQLYDDFTNECHEMADSLNKDYLSNTNFMDAAVSVGIEWSIAEKWVQGEVV